MMKNLSRRQFVKLTALAAGAVVAAGCGATPTATAVPPTATKPIAPTATSAPVAAPTTTKVPAALATTAPVAVPTATTAPAPAAAAPSVAAVAQLTAGEIAGLNLMREEEKLARDVYLYLYNKWGLRTFSNIAESEQTHMDSIKTLLDRYGLPDPASGKAAGVFGDAHLQELYNQLIAQGSKSTDEAWNVGIAIEELDIDDLEKLIAATTKADIILVYQNLLKGSESHLAAFSGKK